MRRVSYLGGARKRDHTAKGEEKGGSVMSGQHKTATTADYKAFCGKANED